MVNTDDMYIPEYMRMRIQYSRNPRGNCIMYRLLDSGLVQLKGKNRILYTLSQERIKVKEEKVM